MMVLSSAVCADIDGIPNIYEEGRYAERQKTSNVVSNVYVIADKSKGEIVIHYNNGDIKKSSALFGVNKSDKYDDEIFNGYKKVNGVTPAGTYTLKKYMSLKLHEYILVFIDGTHKKAAIHSVWTGNPKQERVKRLNSPTSADNRITSGCINVDPIFFNDHLVNLPDNTQLIILPES